jgi:drug/metabolite transporter (DMT)-like permease
MTLAGAAFWQPMSGADWGWTAVNGGLAILSNWLMIRCYAVAEAGAVQPFAYLQLVFIAIMGTLVFRETLTTATVIGAVIVAGAGLFTLLATRRQPKEIAS